VHKQNETDPDGDLGKVHAFESDWRQGQWKAMEQKVGFWFLWCVWERGKEDDEAMKLR